MTRQAIAETPQKIRARLTRQMRARAARQDWQWIGGTRDPRTAIPGWIDCQNPPRVQRRCLLLLLFHVSCSESFEHHLTPNFLVHLELDLQYPGK
jgi:hypothetical protein